jgi:predicted RNase H-like nuclease
VPYRATVRVLGVDGCRSGWAGIVWDGSALAGAHGAGLDELLEDAGPVDLIGIDMPIGLADTGIRQADLQARAALGAAASSIFVTPTRAALQAPTQALATAANRERGGQGVSAQAYALRPKILEVDAWVRARSRGPRVVEVHPELSFRAMSDQRVLAPKRTWQGAAERRRLLRSHGLDLDAVDLGRVARIAAADDVADAAAAAWTAARAARGIAASCPDPPEVFSDGWPCAIWT